VLSFPNTANIMLRSGRTSTLARSSLRYIPFTTSRTTISLARANTTRPIPSLNTAVQTSSPYALTIHKPFSTSLQRYASHPGNPLDKIDRKHEEKIEHEVIEPHPGDVSTTSSVHQVFHEKGTDEPEKDEDMMAGVKADFVRRPPINKPGLWLT
jgi:hypothetical protein